MLQSIFRTTWSVLIDMNLDKVFLQVVVVCGMHDSCVSVMSVCEIYQRMIIKLTVQAFAILYFYFVFVQFVCQVSQMPSQLVSLDIKIISIELL